MQILTELYHSIYFNFFSFGTLLATVFMLVCGVFLMQVPKMQRSTFHLGLSYILFSIFYFGYFTAAVFYHPLAAYHRWITVGFILLLEIHILQWFLRYPRTTHPRLARWVLIGQYSLSLTLILLFILKTLKSEKIYNFNGHYWDFQAEGISYIISLVIILYVVVMIPASIWKMRMLKGSEKWAVLKVLLGVLAGALIPSWANSQSRDGLLERGTYLNLLVLMVILGFFYVIIVYLNTTKERTSFMAKIIGITMVTFLIMMQGVSFIVMQGREAEFDSIRIENMERALEGGGRNSGIQYILELSYGSGEIIKKDYQEKYDLRLEHIRVDLMNNIILEEIDLIPDEKFKENLRRLLLSTHSEFEGYQKSLLTFLDSTNADGNVLRVSLRKFISKLNQTAFYYSNKISLMDEDNFCRNAEKLLRKKEDSLFFRQALEKRYRDCLWNGKEISVKNLKYNIAAYFRPFKRVEERHFRKSHSDLQHFITYGKYFPATKTIREVGFSYETYRQYMHIPSKLQKIILAFVLIVILFLYPTFFKDSLSAPLMSLLAGVRQVNKGHLNVRLPVKVEDEIGYITGSFNKMVKSIEESKHKLEDYANRLEEKVEERTKELAFSLAQVENLKSQQDGDYFLTTLLLNPLSINGSVSTKVKIDFFIKQKKEFKFRSRSHDIGGDMCISQEITLKKKKYVAFLNADAMGKSIQGAGGVLVLGAVFHSIIQRTHTYKVQSEVAPEYWIKNTFKEMHKIFESFNGSMLISLVFGLVEENTGLVYFINAEHPWVIEYRNRQAHFIENDLTFRKLGTSGVESEIFISTYQMTPGSLLIMGSDGKDDIVQKGRSAEERIVNEDETLFLKKVEEADGDLGRIFSLISDNYELIDDFSLLSITYNGDEIYYTQDELQEQDVIMKKAAAYFRQSRYEDAIAILRYGHDAYRLNSHIAGFLVRTYMKAGMYKEAADAGLDFLLIKDSDTNLMLRVSYALKKNRRIEEAIDLSERIKLREPSNLANLVHLADMYTYRRNFRRADKLLNKIFKLDSENEAAIKIRLKLDSLVSEVQV